MSKATTKKQQKAKPAGAGGSKGRQIVQIISDAGKAGVSRTEVAEQVGCTVQRVGEVIRAHGGITKNDDKRYVLTGPAKVTERAEANKAAAAKSRKGNPELENYKLVISSNGAEGDFDAAAAYAKRTKKKAPKRAA